MITTNQTLSTFDVADRMFSHWRQENFFRYLRHEFDLDQVLDPAQIVQLERERKLLIDAVAGQLRYQFGEVGVETQGGEGAPQGVPGVGLLAS